MRVLMLSKGVLRGPYQRKLEELASLGVELRVLAPPAWHEGGEETRLERVHLEGYELVELPLRFPGRFHLHYYPGFAQQLESFDPHLVHLDEEPYNLATFHAAWQARAGGRPFLFFTWQNLRRRYPPPFSWMQSWVLAHAALALAGSVEAAEVLRSKGFAGRLRIVPQFGVDEQLFQPAPEPQGPFTIGYAGRLVPQKGLDVLLRAAAGLPGEWRLRLAGSGPEEARLRRLAGELGVGDRLHIEPFRAGGEMPAFYRSIHLLVLPSRTWPNWKEQFGRVLVEAMAAGRPVVGSASGEIPHTIGPAGLIFPEGDEGRLRELLGELMARPDRRRELAELGQTRVLERFTQRQVARETLAAYRLALGREEPGAR